jgi:hypothetical protein
MRKTLLTSAALLGLALALPAFAQNTNGTGTNGTAPPPSPHRLMRSGAMNPATGARYGHRPGVGVSEPYSARASNILPADTHSVIAPTLPTPPVGPNAGAEQYLRVAQRALQQHRGGEMQEALERAETRRLDLLAQRYPVPPTNDPVIMHIRRALDALGMHDFAVSGQEVSEAIAADAAHAGMGGGGMQGTGMYRGRMNRGPMNGPGMMGAGMPASPGGPSTTGQGPVFNSDTSSKAGGDTGNPSRSSEPGTLGTEVSPPGTPMNPNGTATGNP